MGPRAGLDRHGKSRPPPGFDPRTVQSIASRYNNYAILAHTSCTVRSISDERQTYTQMNDYEYRPTKRNFIDIYFVSKIRTYSPYNIIRSAYVCLLQALPNPGSQPKLVVMRAVRWVINSQNKQVNLMAETECWVPVLLWSWGQYNLQFWATGSKSLRTASLPHLDMGCIDISSICTPKQAKVVHPLWSFFLQVHVRACMCVCLCVVVVVFISIWKNVTQNTIQLSCLQWMTRNKILLREINYHFTQFHSICYE